MRILLVMPTPFESGRLGLENVVWLSEPVALTAIGAAVNDQHDVRILDLRLEEEGALVTMLQTWQPDLIGTTSMTTDAYQAKAVLRTARQICPGALTVVGGHHPTLTPEEFEDDFIDVIVQGEGELTFRELVARWDAQRAAQLRTFAGVMGLRYKDAAQIKVNGKRPQTQNLDELPVPDRNLIKAYQGRYFFTCFRPMASIYTSRGCSFDCNFCAIWEFYERRTRFLSAAKIVDQMESASEPFVFVLDDNFLTNKRRATELCDELERRGVKKYWMTQGRTDFAADHPELMARLAKNGLVMVLSGFESNSDDNLAALRKKSSWQKNVRANEVLRAEGIFSTGIFMVRADWTVEQFRGLAEYVDSLDIMIPLFTILTPLPGTQLYKTYRDQLLTHDHRLFDLLHAVLPTRLPRPQFYAEFARLYDVSRKSAERATVRFLKSRPAAVWRARKGLLWFYARTWRYLRIQCDPQSFLRDEEGLLTGPGTQKQLGWEDIQYPTGDEHEAAPAPAPPKRVRLRVTQRTWADDMTDRAQSVPAGAE